MKHNFCVWIDHNEAGVFGITSSNADSKVIVDEIPYPSKGRPYRARDGNDEFRIPRRNGRGPAAGKGHSRRRPRQSQNRIGRISDKYPALAKRIWAIEPMDHPGDGELVAAVRKYFHAATGMHQ